MGVVVDVDWELVSVLLFPWEEFTTATEEDVVTEATAVELSTNGKNRK